MADLKLIETNIVSTLQLVTELQKVYDHEPKSLIALPAATLFFDGFGQQDQANRRKTVNWRWVVRLYVKLGEAEKAQNDLKTLVINTLNRLRSNPTLGSSCLFHNVTNGEIHVMMDQNNPHLIAEMFLEATTHENY